MQVIPTERAMATSSPVITASVSTTAGFVMETMIAETDLMRMLDTTVVSLDFLALNAFWLSVCVKCLNTDSRKYCHTVYFGGSRIKLQH